MWKMLLGAASAALAVAPAPAREPRVAVGHADLRLDRARDVLTLDRRIARAAQGVCGAASDADLRGRNQARRCRGDTIASVAAARTRLIGDATRPALAAAR